MGLFIFFLCLVRGYAPLSFSGFFPFHALRIRLCLCLSVSLSFSLFIPLNLSVRLPILISIYSLPLCCHFRIFFFYFRWICPWQFSLNFFVNYQLFRLFSIIHLAHYPTFYLSLFHIFGSLSTSLPLALSLSHDLPFCLYIVHSFSIHE